MSQDIIGKAFTYTKEGFVGNWMRWILLLVCVFIQSITLFLVPLFNGYLLRVAGANDSAPEVNDLVKLFIDGWKANIAVLIYMIPAIVLAFVLGFMALAPELMAILSGGTPNIELFIGMLVSLAIVFLVVILIALFMFIGLIRLGQTGNLSEAFNFSAINDVIESGVGGIGYIGYCILLWIIVVLYYIVMGLLISNSFEGIKIVGFIFLLILTPLVSVFAVSYLRNIYNAGKN